MSELALFDLDPSMVARPVAPALDESVDLNALAEWAFLYTITETGTATGVRFMATREDAMRWCSSDLSRGQLHGTRWVYAWTSVANFIEHREGWLPAHGGKPKLTIALDTSADNGLWDERIASTGCRKVSIPAIPATLAALGVEVKVA